MSDDPLKNLIFYTLIKAKQLVKDGDYDLVNRNLKFIASKGLKIPDVKKCILSLTPSDYKKGPEKDYDDTKEGSIFIFMKSYEEMEIYIKFKIIKIDENKEQLKIISFHD